MVSQTRLPFELDQRAETGFMTAHGGVPLLIEAFRSSGAAAMLDASVVIKRSARATYDGRTGYQPVVALWPSRT